MKKVDEISRHATVVHWHAWELKYLVDLREKKEHHNLEWKHLISQFLPKVI